jgi:DNA-binding response OmpR family regulator
VDEPATAERPELPTPTTLRSPAERRGTILVVDDDPAVLDLMASVLSTRGHAVIRAPNASAAVQAMEHHAAPIDLLVSDVMMPGRSGPELAAELRAAQPALRVLLVSGYSEGAIELPDPERDDLLEKPFSPDELVARVERLLSPSP